MKKCYKLLLRHSIFPLELAYSQQLTAVHSGTFGSLHYMSSNSCIEIHIQFETLLVLLLVIFF